MKTRELRALVRTRPNVTSDQYVCGEVCGEYKHLQLKDKVVLDLGGNIGAFAVYAAEQGCGSCHTFEPDEENFELLLENTKPYPQISAVIGAVTTSPNNRTSFYLTTGAARDGFSTVPFNGRIKKDVANMHIRAVLAAVKPSVIKMDVEGEEFAIVDYWLAHSLPKYVKELVTEIHFSKKAFREGYERFISLFESWEVVVQPKNTGKNFHTIGHWRRK